MNEEVLLVLRSFISQVNVIWGMSTMKERKINHEEKEKTKVAFVKPELGQTDRVLHFCF